MAKSKSWLFWGRKKKRGGERKRYSRASGHWFLYGLHKVFFFLFLFFLWKTKAPCSFIVCHLSPPPQNHFSLASLNFWVPQTTSSLHLVLFKNYYAETKMEVSSIFFCAGWFIYHHKNVFSSPPVKMSYTSCSLLNSLSLDVRFCQPGASSLTRQKIPCGWIPKITSVKDSYAAILCVKYFFYQQLFLNHFSVTKCTWTHKTKMSPVFPWVYVNPIFLSHATLNR